MEARAQEVVAGGDVGQVVGRLLQREVVDDLASLTADGLRARQPVKRRSGFRVKRKCLRLALPEPAFAAGLRPAAASQRRGAAAYHSGHWQKVSYLCCGFPRFLIAVRPFEWFAPSGRREAGSTHGLRHPCTMTSVRGATHTVMWNLMALEPRAMKATQGLHCRYHHVPSSHKPD